jgi:hypothetical protein
MQQLPSSATGRVSAAKEYDFATLQKQEVLLHQPQGSTGGGDHHAAEHPAVQTKPSGS